MKTYSVYIHERKQICINRKIIKTDIKRSKKIDGEKTQENNDFQTDKYTKVITFQIIMNPAETWHKPAGSS